VRVGLRTAPRKARRPPGSASWPPPDASLNDGVMWNFSISPAFSAGRQIGHRGHEVHGPARRPWPRVGLMRIGAEGREPEPLHEPLPQPQGLPPSRPGAGRPSNLQPSGNCPFALGPVLSSGGRVRTEERMQVRTHRTGRVRRTALSCTGQ
jgi:hypothetical protein